MPPAADQDYTKVLDFDFSQPGVLPDHDGECGSGGNGVPGGETLPLAFTETQPLDDCGEQLDVGVKDWGETQVIDEFQETEVVRGEEEEGEQSERTELVTEENDDFVGEVGSGIHTKDGNLVDPDSSTDEEEGCGSEGPVAGDISSLQLTGGSCKSSDECPRKSFVTIRVAALRSGFAAAHNRTCTPIIDMSESSNLSEGKFNAYNQDKFEDNYTGLRANWMETMPCSVSNLNNVGTKKDEIYFDHDALRAAAGYVSSQEPGIQSQTIALGIVDKFLSVNDLGLSQHISNVNTDTVISPPIASVKKAQSFVMKSDINTLLKPDVYEWNDSLEDEGVDLFSKREYYSFDRKRSKQRFRSLPLEVIPRGSELIVGADNKGNNEGSKSKACQKLASIACSGSKLKHIQSERHLHAYKTRSKKKRFNEMGEPENTGGNSDVHTFDEGVYDVGPATQIAAEAIQALCHSSPVNLEQTNPQSKSGELVGTSINLKKPRNAFTRKKSNKPQESVGIMTRSKHQINITNSRTTSYNSYRKQSTNLRTKMVLEESAVEITAMMTEKNLDENHEGVISFNNGGSAASIVRKKMKITVDEDTENPLVSVAHCNQPLVGPKSILGSSQIYTSPVAHRTRHSKAANLLNFNKRLSNDTSIDTSEINICGRRKVETKKEHVLNAPVTPKVNKNDCNISLNATISGELGFSGLADAFEMERVHVEETGASLDKDAYRETKRRKNNIDSENQRSECKMDNHSKSFDVIAPKNVKLSNQRKKQRVFIRSIAEILDMVKRKRRSVSSSSKSQSDGLPSNAGNAPNVSGFKTRSSLLSDILKPYFTNDSNYKPQLSSKPAFDGASCTHSVSSVKQVVFQDNLKESIKGAESSLLAKTVKESIKPEGSPDAISHPSLACSPAIGIIDVSPVSISQDSSKISAHKSLSRSSIARELIRLEANNTSPSKLNDIRRRKNMSSFQVCFSNHLSQDIIKQQKKILARLGIQVVSSGSEATHFVADKFLRTRNMLEAMAMGKPVVTPMWLESCGQASCYIDEKNYILRDANKEKEIGFSMPVSLARACHDPLLQGKRFFITQNTKPNQELISSLVNTAGGQLLKRITRSISKEDKLPDNLLILSSEEDFAVCVPFLEKGAAVFRSELLLNGIVIQKLEYERHQLFLDQVKR